MSTSPDDFAARRALLSAQIARQRGDLAQAYLDLKKPIHYAEYGLRGFGFLRNNPWVFVAVPAAFSIFSTLFGLRKSKAPKPEPRQSLEPKKAGFKNNLVTWAGHAWRLYQLYRRVRPHFM